MSRCSAYLDSSTPALPVQAAYSSSSPSITTLASMHSGEEARSQKIDVGTATASAEVLPEGPLSSAASQECPASRTVFPEQEVLKSLAALNFPMPPDGHPARTAWAAILQGRDFAAEAPPIAHVQIALPPFLAMLACMNSLRLLVLAPSPWADQLHAELSLRGNAIGITAAAPTDSNVEQRWPEETQCMVGNPKALRSLLKSMESCEALSGNLVVALLWCERILDEEKEDLYNLLRSLPQPKQSAMLASVWTENTKQLQSQILIQPFWMQQLSPGGLPQDPKGQKQFHIENAKSKTVHGKYLSDRKAFCIVGGGKKLVQCAVGAAGCPERAKRIAEEMCNMINAGATIDEAKIRKEELLSMRGEEIVDENHIICAQDPENTTAACTGARPTDESAEAASAAMSAVQCEHASLLAKYLSNIVCRSSNRELRNEVFELLPRKRKSDSMGSDTTASQSQEEEEELQQQAIQHRIANLLSTFTARLAATGSVPEQVQSVPFPSDYSGWLSGDDSEED